MMNSLLIILTALHHINICVRFVMIRLFSNLILYWICCDFYCHIWVLNWINCPLQINWCIFSYLSFNVFIGPYIDFSVNTIILNMLINFYIIHGGKSHVVFISIVGGCPQIEKSVCYT